MNEKSSGTALRAAVGGGTHRKAQSFPQMLQQFGDQITMALPKHLTKDRMTRIAMTAFNQNEKLAACEPRSVFACVIMSAQLGLEIGVLGQSFLVPYKQRNGSYVCQLIPGWQGLQDLVNRSGRASTWTGAVYSGDEFDYEYGTSPNIHHKPCGEDDPKALLYTYAVGRVKGGEYPIIEVWPALKLTRHRDRLNRQGDKHYSFREWEMYARKIPLLQVFKYVPKSIEFATAIALDASADAGTQSISLNDAVRGDFLPPVAEQDAQIENSEADDSGIADPRGLINAASSTAELSEAWKLICENSQGNVPIDLEAAKNDRMETLRQQESKIK